MPRRQVRRKNFRTVSRKSGSGKTAGNMFLNTSIGVLTLLTLALVYSWGHRQFIAKPGFSNALITLADEPTTLTSRMWMEKQFRDIKVEVLNGIGIDGVAARTTEYLREMGFDVVKTYDAGRTDYIYSVVKDRAGNLNTARRLAEVLHVDTLSVFQELNKSLILDVTVVIGRDYANLAPFLTSEELP